jgi:hypothetical protein
MLYTMYTLLKSLLTMISSHRLVVSSLDMTKVWYLVY